MSMVVPPAPSTHAPFDNLRRRVDRLREPSPLESQGPAWHEAALRHIDLSASLLDLTETLIDVKLKLEARDTERGRRISDSMTKTLGEFVAQIQRSYAKEDGVTTPEPHALLRENLGRETIGALEAAAAEKFAELCQVEDGLRGKAFEAYPEQHWLPACQQRDAARRDGVMLWEVAQAGREALRKISEEGTTDLAQWVSTLERKLSSTPAPSEDLVEEKNDSTKMRLRIVRGEVSKCINRLRGLIAAPAEMEAETSDSSAPNGLSRSSAFQRGLHDRRLQLVAFMADLRAVHTGFQKTSSKAKDLDAKVDNLEDLTEEEEERLENEIDALRGKAAQLARMREGLQSQIRELCLDSVSWQRRRGFAGNDNSSGAVNAAGAVGEAKTTSAAGDADDLGDLAETQAFPDVWVQCKAVIVQKRRRGRRRKGSSYTDLERKVKLRLEKLGLLLHGRSREDYCKDELPKTMVEGTRNYVHVEGMRLKGVKRSKKGVDPSLKILKKIPVTDEKRIRSALVYANRLQHKFIVKVDGAFLEDDNLVVQTQFYPGGSLRQWCMSNIRDDQVKTLIIQKVADGMAFLHANALIHRDIKPGNIVMSGDQDGASPGLTDFDISKSLDTMDLVTMKTREGAGTLRYMSPELLAQPPRPPSFESDVYALGVTFLEVLLSDCDETKLLRLAAEIGVNLGEIPQWTDIIAGEIAKIDTSKQPKRREMFVMIGEMLSADPEERPSAKEVARRTKVIATSLGSCECFTCYDLFENTAGVVCPEDETHFLCEACLNNGYLKTTIENLKTEADSKMFKCAYPGCVHEFSQQDMLKHISGANLTCFEAKMAQLVREQTREEERERYEEEKKREAAKSALQKDVDARRKHIEEEIMTLRCPRCHQAFVDYNACAALTCSRSTCRCGFCAYCLADCGSDAHSHCQQVHGGYWLKFPEFQEVQRKLRVEKLGRYWKSLTDEVRDAMSRNPGVQQHFKDLRMEVPGGARQAAVRFATQMAQLRAMGMLVPGRVDEEENALRVLQLVDGDINRAINML